MAISVERNPGEVLIKFSEPAKDKLSFSELGLTDEDLEFTGGTARLVFDFGEVGEHEYYKVPTVELGSKEEIGDSRWICELNETVVLDTSGHHGRKSILLMDRDKMLQGEHHHTKKLVVHGRFDHKVSFSAKDSSLRLFQ